MDTARPPLVTPEPALWALLVGIDTYRSGRLVPLRGAVNDVLAMRTLLMTQYGVPASQICVLTNSKATRGAILETFRTFLTRNPAIPQNAEILFQFCGHGSQMLDLTGTELDGLAETIVPYDSRTVDIYDIPDKTLAGLLAELCASKGRHVTVVLDCCHAGSGTRWTESSSIACIRQVELDDRPPPPDLDNTILFPTLRRGAAPSGWWIPGLPYVLLAACRDYELARELPGIGDTKEEVWFGAFTYHVVDQLRQLPPDATYGDLVARVASQVHAVYATQMPQCEGDKNRSVFQGIYRYRDPLVPIQFNHDTVSVEAGIIHGLRPGTQMAAYPLQVRSLAFERASPLATIQIVASEATTSQATLLGETSYPLPARAQAVVTKHAYAGLRQSVHLWSAGQIADDQLIAKLSQAILTATPTQQPSPYLHIELDEHRPADLHVLAKDGLIHLFNSSGDELVQSEELREDARGQLRATVDALESIARYHNVLSLTNQDDHSRLACKIHLSLRRYVPGTPVDRLPLVESARGGNLTVVLDPMADERNVFVVEIKNTSTFRVYPHVFTLSPDYSIGRLYPRLGEEEAIPPEGTAFLGLDSPQERLLFYLPEGWKESQDCLKAIFTLTPSDLGLLEQGGLRVAPPRHQRTRGTGLDSPLLELLTILSEGENTRFIRPSRAPVHEDWTTVELVIRTTRGR